MVDQPTGPSADLLSRGKPALSATSDMPEPPDGTQPPLSEQRTPPPETTAEPVTTTAAPVTTDAPQGSTEEPVTEPPTTEKPDGLNKRFSELTAQRKAAEARADGLAIALERAITALEKAATPPAANAADVAKTAAEADPRPERAAFDEPNKYDDALIEWSTRQATRVAQAEAKRDADAEKSEADTKAAEERIKAENETALKAFNDRRTKALDEFSDYAEVAEAEDVQITVPMAAAIMNAYNGPAIAYHLGKHKDEAARIAAIANPTLQLIEIGKISAQLSGVAKPVSKAPAPIEPVGQRANALPKGPNEESMEEYGARRARELAEARRARGSPAN